MEKIPSTLKTNLLSIANQCDFLKFPKLTDDKRDIVFEAKGELPTTDISNIIYTNTPSFTGCNVSITEIANVIGKTPETIRYVLREGIFRFGVVIESENLNKGILYTKEIAVNLTIIADNIE